MAAQERFPGKADETGNRNLGTGGSESARQ